MPDVPKAGRLFDRRWLSWDRARLDADVLDAIVTGLVISTPKQVGLINLRAEERKFIMEKVCCAWSNSNEGGVSINIWKQEIVVERTHSTEAP